MNRRAESVPLLLLLFCLIPVQSLALSSDREQPLEIEADRVALDDPRRTATYTGGVVLTRGSIEAHADRIDIYMTPAETINRIVMTGRPATFRQLTDEGVEIYGEGLRIEYLEEKAYLKIEDRGLLRRGPNEFRGPLIEFDLDQEIVTASSREEQSEDGRVRITIQPSPAEASDGDGPERPAP
jgi:lipopolysaccharide export system protein LptA